ncbi:MAG: diaminopimelate decarboxylase, partial [Deltaproteobacteria bacterium]|nr:diaminopimelate decarboxylase [Deltaproteobacteria bacterium]
MHDFQYHQNELYCEEVPINKIADKVGTPFYLYSNHTLENHFKVFDSAFNGIDHLTCFSVKANSNLTVLKIFVNLGGGVDIVSGGELFRALNSGVDPSKVVFSGVGKGIKELEYALEAGILMFNVESTQELTTINQVAQRIGRKAKIALRVNPHIDPQTHPYISTGLKKNKFGIEINQALEDYREAKKLKHIEIVGVDCHIGSQITELQPFVETLRKVKELVLTLRQEAIEIQYVDLGGGLGITYHQEQPPHPREYASALIKEMQDINCTLILEPGRVIAGNAGILVTKVLYLKKGTKKTFVTVDAAMNDLIRPSLYGAF